MSERFSTRERIRRRADYLRIQREGSRTHGRFVTLVGLPNGSDTPRLGVTASRRLGAAAARNRAKRLIREVFRRNKPTQGLIWSSSPGASCSTLPSRPSRRIFAQRSDAMSATHASRPSSFARLPQAAIITAIRLYQLSVSQLFSGSCRFLPSCSSYAAEAVSRHGSQGLRFCAIRRLARCHPSARAATTRFHNFMEKRVLLAFALSFLVWFVYQSLIGPRQPSRPGTPARTEPASPQSPATGQPGDAGTTAAAPPAPVSPASAPLVAGEREREVVVETDAVRATFSSREGVLKSWRLKRYLDWRPAAGTRAAGGSAGDAGAVFGSTRRPRCERRAGGPPSFARAQTTCAWVPHRRR